jgi:hypothetical protein
MVKKLKQTVDMAGFFKEIGGEHNTFLELITNGIEEAKKNVFVTYNEKTGLLIVENDGNSLSEEQIETVLLRSFKSGDEKVAAESNRGLGFIVIYHDGKETVVYTGKYKVTIRSWDDIDLEVVEKEQPGMRVEVLLTDEARGRYSEHVVRATMDSWIFANGISLYYNNEKVGHYIDPLKDVKKKRDGMKYVVNRFISPDDYFSIVLKLTNKMVYRILPINVDRMMFCPEIKTFTLIIEKGEWLNTARTSLSYMGDYYLKEIAKSETKKYMERSAEENKATIMEMIADDIVLALDGITLNIGLKSSFFKNTINFYKTKFKKLDFIGVVKEIKNMNKFISMINTSKIIERVVKIEEIDSTSSFLSLMVRELKVGVYSFHGWFTDRFDYKIESFFLNERIGLMVNNGNISGEATVKDLIKVERCVELSTDLFQGNCLEEETIVILFNNDTEFFLCIDDYTVELESITEKNTVKVDIKEEDRDISEFGIGKDQATVQEAKIAEILTIPDEGIELDVDKVEDIIYDSGTLSCQTSDGRIIEVTDVESVKLLDETGFEMVSGPSLYGDDEDIQEELVKEPAVFHITKEDEESDDEETQEVIKAVEEKNPIPDFLSKHIVNEKESKNVKVEMESQKLSFEVLDINEIRIPCLISEKSQKDFNYVVKYPGVKRNKKILKAYQQWKSVIDLVMKYVPEITSRVVPVISWDEDRTVAANHVGRFIGINYWYLPNLSDMKLQKILKMLETAVHEITHTLYGKHSDPKFVATYNTIWDTVIADRDFMKELKSLF